MSFSKLSNPKQQSYNVINMTKGAAGCCGGDTTVCKYTFDTDFATPVEGLTVDGVPYLFSALGIAPSATAAELKMAIYMLMKAAGYVEVKQDNEDVAVGTSYTETAGVYTFSIIADGAITFFNDGAEKAVEAKCTRVGVCQYEMFVGAGAVSITINGTTTALTPLTYTVGTSAATAATAKAELEAIAEVNSANVAVVDSASGYTLAVSTKYEVEGWKKCSCYQSFE